MSRPAAHPARVSVPRAIRARARAGATGPTADRASPDADPRTGIPDADPRTDLPGGIVR